MMNISMEEYAEMLQNAGLQVVNGAVMLSDACKELEGMSLRPSFKLVNCYSDERTAESIMEDLKAAADDATDGDRLQEVTAFAERIRKGDDVDLRYVLTRDLGVDNDTITDFLGMKLCVYACGEGFSACITPGLLDAWGMSSVEEVLPKVSVHQQWECTSMLDYLNSMAASIPEDVAGLKVEMYIVTNKDKMNGAAVLLDTDYLEELRRRFGDYMIIPSSRHEVLAVPLTCAPCADYAREMVQEVNDTQVDYADVLSYDVFTFTERGLEIA